MPKHAPQPAWRRRAGQLWRRRLRPFLVEATHGPDFLILGAQKAGTTFLARLLRQQAWALPPKIKEIHYFDAHYSHGERWYRSHFAGAAAERAARRERGVDRLLRYEATPDYLHHPAAAQRIGAVAAAARLVVVLRDPVERAVSHYGHMRRAGLETRPLDQAIAADDSRASAREGGELSETERLHAYVDRGRYWPQIERFRRRFPDERLLIVFFDDLIAAPQATLDRLCAFLDVAPTPLRDLAPQNAGDGADAASPETAALIRRACAEADAALWAAVGLAPRW